MESKLFKIFLLIGITLAFAACEDEDVNAPLTGSQSVMGEDGNVISTLGLPNGISSASGTVVDVTDGVSTFDISLDVSNSNYLDILSQISGVEVNGSKVSGELRYKITDKGIEAHYDEGELVLVKYDAEVGDVYSLKKGTTTIKREVTAKSTEDDYVWGGIWLYLKTITVREVGRNIPGISYCDYYFNHKYGFVGMEVFFEDGSSEAVNITSNNYDY